MRDLTPKTEKTNSGPSSKSDAPVRGAPGLPACMTAALGQSAVFVGLGLIFLTAFFTCLDPWVADAVSAQTFGFVSLRQVLYNLVKLFEGKGGYAQWLWGVLVFLSLSIWFHEAGKIAFKKIISRGVTESASLPPLSALERFSCHWILGSGIWSLVWFFLGLAGLYRKSLALALVFAGLLFLLRKAHLGMQSFSARSPEPEPKNLFTFSAVAAAVLFLWVLSWILPANHPVYYWDTWMVNLALPGYYAAESRLVYNPFNIYSYFSQNSEMLTVWALLAGSKAAAFLLVWGFFAALLLFFYGWISRAASRAAALCAISLFISSQLGWWLATNIKNDLQPAVFLILQWWALLQALDLFTKGNKKGRNWMFLAGVSAGLACGHKFTSVTSVLPTLAGSGLYFMLNPAGGRRWEQTLKWNGLFMAGALLAWSPWLIRNSLATGNPVYPFLHSLFKDARLYPWHGRPPSDYTLLSQGIRGAAEYVRNLSQTLPVSPLGYASIWWGSSAFLTLTGFAVLSKKFRPEVRWVAGMAAASWFLSLLFALKPPYHAGPLIFIFCFCFALTAEGLFRNPGYPWAKILLIAVVVLDFLRGATNLNTKRSVLLPGMALLSGSPPYHYISSFSGGTAYADIDELEWVLYLINKYSRAEDKVLFMGCARSAGIRRRHYAAFSLSQQPLLHFAEACKDRAELQQKLLSLGVRHVVYDPLEWADWVRNKTVDGPHNLPVKPETLDKVREWLQTDVTARFSVPSGRLQWLTLRSADSKEDPGVPIDAEDTYAFPQQYLKLANRERNAGQTANVLAILRELGKNTFANDLEVGIHRPLGFLAAGQKNYALALESFSRCIQADPKNAVHYINRGAIYFEAGQVLSAFKDVSAALALEPGKPEWLMARARLYEAMGDRARAEEDAARVRLLQGKIR